MIDKQYAVADMVEYDPEFFYVSSERHNYLFS